PSPSPGGPCATIADPLLRERARAGEISGTPSRAASVHPPLVRWIGQDGVVPEQTMAVNRRARHEFTIDETFEAGIVLTGTEIKSIRSGKVNLSDAYARIERDEAWLVGAHIAPFEQGNRNNHEPKRTRKLLLH